MAEISARMQKYINSINEGINKAYDVANSARKKGFDPEPKVDMPLVEDMAGRVEGLISVVAPQIINSGVSERIKELESEYASLDWRVALTISLEIAKEKFCKFKDKKEAMEIGIRAGFAYITMGVVASPLEGFVELKIMKRNDGKEYFSVKYAGPVRSAGGTGASVSLMIIDYVRKNMGYDVYDPTEDEVKRYVTEAHDYHERITNLQYLPSDEEIEFMAKNCPIQIDGDGSEKIEVSNYKDLPRVETNKIRNGVCLVMCEAICQKAPKVWKQISVWGDDFGLTEWKFIGEFVKLQKDMKSKGKVKTEKKEKISPNFTFIQDLVAGRPVFSHPLRRGGFRLRFGRSRTSGYSANSVHPATMYIMNSYLATGTQLKVERPGKATALTVCDSVEGPIVKLNDDSVFILDSMKDAKEYISMVKEVLYLGDMLVNYGDFFNRAHSLVPPGYCEEWWIQELEKATVELFGSLDMHKLSEMCNIQESVLYETIKRETNHPNPEAIISLSMKLKIPLHPAYTFHWNSIPQESLKDFILWMNKANIISKDEYVQKLVIPIKKGPKRFLELAGVPHNVVNKEFVVIEKNYAFVLSKILGLGQEDIKDKIERIGSEEGESCSLNSLNRHISPIFMRDKSGVFIGARMGRPEKAKMRKLDGSPHVLFPVGTEGGRMRSFQSALEAKNIRSDFPLFRCKNCNRDTIFSVCESCGNKTDKRYFCKICGIIPDEKCVHGEALPYKTQNIDINHFFHSMTKKLGMRNYPDLIKGVRGTSNKAHIPENLAKGILRSKHNIYVNKDGTTRYDMTQLPITHFKPKEIGTPIERLIELGYTKDINSNELVQDNQVLELKPQDVILPSCDESPEEGADKVLFRVSKFIDELLVKFYGLEPYYSLLREGDLVGHLVLCLAPHTSAAITTRIIGFSKTQGFFAHPLIHAATRRDCDGDEACVTLLMDALLNFSRKYLPAHRGSTQDAPLVLTSKLTPAEVDDMIFDMDVVWQYPLSFYDACLEYKNPWDVKLDQVSGRLGTEKQYEGMGFTHDTDTINDGVRCSAYKTLPSMEEKLKGQMDLAEKIQAVDTSDVARLVIEKHFLKDTKGNLRKFSMQQFRCVNCNTKYRRPPLAGKCTSCKGGKIIFTISEGSVVKYLMPTISLAEKYNVPVYLKQTINLLQQRVESVFGKDKEKQMGLGKWFG